MKVQVFLAALLLMLFSVVSPFQLYGQCIVTNPDNTGVGTLREALDCTSDGDTIFFDNSMNGVPILLLFNTLLIDKDITIYAGPTQDILISADDPEIASTVTIDIGKTVVIHGVEILGGSNQPASALFNQGSLTLVDVELSRGLPQNLSSILVNAPGATVTIRSGSESRVD